MRAEIVAGVVSMDESDTWVRREKGICVSFAIEYEDKVGLIV